MRTIIELSEEQLARLAEVADREGISRAEAIRRAVDAAYADVAVAGSRAAREAVFGLWKGRKIEALRYVDKLRDEWEDRLAELHGPRYASPGSGYPSPRSAAGASRASEKRPRKRRKK